MADSSKIVLDDKNNGEEIEIDPSVLEVIMGIAAEKVDGVAEMHGNVRSGINWVLGREDLRRGVEIRVNEDGDLIADVYVGLEAGCNVPKIAKEINVHVIGLVFPEEEEQDDSGTSQLFSDIDEKDKNESTRES